MNCCGFSGGIGSRRKEMAYCRYHTVARDVKELPTVVPPFRKGATVRRHLNPICGPGECLDICLRLAGLVGITSQLPTTVAGRACLSPLPIHRPWAL